MALSRILLVFALAFSRLGFAQKVMVNGSLTQVSEESRRGSVKFGFNTTIFSGSLGLIGEAGFMGGVKYWSYEKKGGFSSDTRESVQTWGPMLGFLHKESGVYALGTWFPGPEKMIRDDTQKTTYSGGDGYLIELGKVWHFNQSAAGGLQISSSQVTYKKSKNSSGTTSDLNGTYSDGFLYPMLALFLFF